MLWVGTGLAKCCRAGGSCRLDLHCLKDRPYSPSRRALHAHTLPHWAGVHQPIRNKPARRSKTNEPLDNPDLRPRHVGWFYLAPSTRCHYCAPCEPCSVCWCFGTCAWKTNDYPTRSASLTKLVLATKVANSPLLTGVWPMRNGLILDLRSGPSQWTFAIGLDHWVIGTNQARSTKNVT